MNKKIIFIICLVFVSAVFSKKDEFISADEIKNMKPRAKKKLLGKSFILKLVYRIIFNELFCIIFTFSIMA